MGMLCKRDDLLYSIYSVDEDLLYSESWGGGVLYSKTSLGEVLQGGLSTIHQLQLNIGQTRNDTRIITLKLNPSRGTILPAPEVDKT